MFYNCGSWSVSLRVLEPRRAGCLISRLLMCQLLITAFDYNSHLTKSLTIILLYSVGQQQAHVLPYSRRKTAHKGVNPQRHRSWGTPSRIDCHRARSDPVRGMLLEMRPLIKPGP